MANMNAVWGPTLTENQFIAVYAPYSSHSLNKLVFFDFGQNNFFTKQFTQTKVGSSTLRAV